MVAERDASGNIDDKLWFQADNTEHGIAPELVQAGIPKSDIVLAFRPPPRAPGHRIRGGMMRKRCVTPLLPLLLVQTKDKSRAVSISGDQVPTVGRKSGAANQSRQFPFIKHFVTRRIPDRHLSASM